MENSSHQLPVELGIGRTWSQEEQMEQAPSPRKESRAGTVTHFPFHLLTHPHLLPSALLHERQQEQEVKHGFPSQASTKDWPQ